jgi:serine protease Do
MTVLLTAAFFFAAVVAARADVADPHSEPAVQAIERVLPAVVNINTERTAPRKGAEPAFEPIYGAPPSRGLSSRSTITSLGSGFLVHPDGYIVTNEHVVERAADLKIWVTLSNKQTYEAKYITGSKPYDLAFIKIEAEEPLPYINLDELSPKLLGQTVLVLGNPLGFGSSVSRGILSGKERTVTIQGNTYRDLLQTDAAINPGNSGGPLIDLAGRLVGVASVKMAQTRQGIPTQGMAFAISGETVREKVDDFFRVASGEPTKEAARDQLPKMWRLLGLRVAEMSAAKRQELGVANGRGVLVVGVDRSSPAGEAGFTEGLVIFKLGNYEVASAQQIEELLETVGAGTVVELTVGFVRRNPRGPVQRQTKLVTLQTR